MSIFLLILKIIGITLLSIIGLILLILALVLFVPIRYTIKGNKPEEGDILAEVKVTWLLHIINVKVRYFKELTYRLRLFIFTLFKSENLKTEKQLLREKKKEERKRKKEERKRIKAQRKAEKLAKKNSKSSGDDVYEIDINEDLIADTTGINDSVIKEDYNRSINNDSAIEYNIKSDDPCLNNQDDDSKIDALDESIDDPMEDSYDELEEKKSIFEKIRFVIEKIIGFIFNIKDKIISLIKKICDIWDNIEYYIEAINDERNKNAFALCKKQIFKVLKSIKPRKIKGNLRYGSDDPYNVGKMMSIYGILFPIIHDKIQVIPEYDEDIIEGDIYIKGKITVFVIIKAGVILFFNKDIRRMLKILKKE